MPDQEVTTLLLASLIFLLTYVLIAVPRLRLLPLDRPGGAMLGAVLMVATGVLAPDAAYRAIDADTLFLLLGMMVITSHLEASGFFADLAEWLARRARSARELLVLLALSAGILSAFLVNDTICLVLTPLVVAVVKRMRLPPVPFLLTLATSSNVGSVMAWTGNPQNMIVGSLSGIPYARYLVRMLPLGLLLLGLHIGVVLLTFRRELAAPLHRGGRGREDAGSLGAPRDPRLRAIALVCLGGTGLGFLLGGHLAWTAMIGATALLVVRPARDPRTAFADVDGRLLLFFAMLFVVVGGLEASGVTEAAFERVAPLLTGGGAASAGFFALFSAVGSNVVSNVPFVAVCGSWIPRFADPEMAWMLLALAATLAGNLTLIGSVANIIVVEGAAGQAHIGFRDYLRLGLPSTILLLGVGTACLLAYRALGWIG